MKITRELYLEARSPETAQIIGSIGYIDDETTREEVHKTAASSDNYQNWRSRISRDNGTTWDPFTDLDEVNIQRDEGGIATYPGVPQVDPATGIRYRPIMKRLWPGNEIYTFCWATHEHPFHDHVFIIEEPYRSSPDSRTAGTRIVDAQTVEMRYENFDVNFDPANPFDPDFYRVNRAYRGQSLCFDGKGGAIHPMTCKPGKYEYGHTKGGVVLMRRESDGRWLPSNQRYVSEGISSRGMLEPDAAILKDGRILIVCRGSNTDECAGRKWMTWSEDGGVTLAPIEEFRYADRTRFYSPSSIHRFYRSTKNGNLYWIGNICNDPPSGNSPRYPLYMGVIDEERMGLIKDSLEIIDDRAPSEPESLSLSNFYLLENRQTLDLELYMTRMAAKSDSWLSSAYRYVIAID